MAVGGFLIVFCSEGIAGEVSAVVNQNYMGCSCTAPFCLGNFMMYEPMA